MAVTSGARIASSPPPGDPSSPGHATPSCRRSRISSSKDTARSPSSARTSTLGVQTSAPNRHLPTFSARQAPHQAWPACVSSRRIQSTCRPGSSMRWRRCRRSARCSTSPSSRATTPSCATWDGATPPPGFVRSSPRSARGYLTRRLQPTPSSASLGRRKNSLKPRCSSCETCASTRSTRPHTHRDRTLRRRSGRTRWLRT
mmetsp:Transcript_16999/g.55384  ORF Transcript_16999/g.55384 Transcript_16999/m.55384 type:complete len:201 (-) Transcript_16999:617-1219(-)